MQVDKERLALVIADNIADQIRDEIMNIVNSYVNVKGNPEKDGKALARKIVFDLAAED